MEQSNSCCKCDHKSWLVGSAVAVAVMVVIFLAVLIRNDLKSYNYIGRTEQQVYTITLAGEGKVTAVPDIAEVSLGIVTSKVKVADAQKENTTKMNQLIKELKGLGIADKDITTNNYSIYPTYDYNTGRQTLTGYQVSQNVTVKIRDLSKSGDVLALAGKSGVNQLGGLSFTIDDPQKLQQQAREKALLDAKQKIQALADVAGVKLGKLVSFTESGNAVPYPRMMYGEMKAISSDTSAAPAPDIQVGSQDIIIDVSVTYEVL